MSGTEEDGSGGGGSERGPEDKILGTGAAYWMATRSYSFPASIVPVLLGTALAARGYGGVSGGFDLLVFVLTLVGALLAHAGGNVLNDYYDFVRGVDTKPEHGSGVLTRGLLGAREMFRFGVALMAGAAVCGGLILLRAPQAFNVVVPLASLGLFCAVMYTPALKQFALGDVAIMTAFGLGLTLGAYGVQTPLVQDSQTCLVLLLSLPLTLLVDAILHANNIRDTSDDSAAGVRTLAGVLGTEKSQQLQAVLLFGPVALVVAFVLLGLLPWSGFAVLLSLPVLVKAYKSGDVPFTAQAHLLFGVLYALSVAVLPRPL